MRANNHVYDALIAKLKLINVKSFNSNLFNIIFTLFKVRAKY